eukprot:TRINITY_DN1719_c0_g1_i2.p1 TRINITY_DN1719_c0_g1~~TRINITY_DN1719_c0_g1_i2.p1  ORF type:complete len:819 (-),score=82.74 TRINITY_DN1719_c0_g1_i2:757-3000(-)
MKTAVRSGEIRKARVVGDSCSIPLTLSKLVRGLVEMAPQQNVRDALSQMKTAVRSGEIRKARVVGDSCSIPLTLSKQQVQLGSRIGGGQEGSVYLGCYQDEQVAVKQARIAATSDLERFREELAILSEIRHPNVVRVLGASAMPPHFFMVTPYYETMLDSVVYSKQWSADWCDILRIGTQLASALECVHAHGYVHRDVKPNNIMLDKDGNAVLIDFGLAADVKKVLTEFEMRQITNPSGGFHKQLMVGTLQYMAPELLLKQPHTVKSDVYAWAVTVNEIATKIFPYSDCTTDNPKAHTILDAGYTATELTSAVVGENLRPTLPEQSPDRFRQLMENCWHADANYRPTMTTVLEVLNDMQDEMLSVPHVSSSINYGGASTLAHSESMNSFESCSTIIGASSPSDMAVMAEFMGPVLLHPSHNMDSFKVHVEEIKHFQDVDMDYIPTITTGSFATAGRRGEDCMEDRHVVQEGGGYTLLSVFDGHRGPGAAEFCAQNVDRYLKSAMKFQDNPVHALSALFMQLDEEFGQNIVTEAQMRDDKIKYSGCTALVSVVMGNQLVVGNAGDCRMVMCRDGRAVQVTNDHTANSEAERLRVEMRGGLVRWMVDGWRVGQTGMQVTRSIGDHDMKQDGVVANPELHRIHLNDKDEFLIIASDGVWDKLENQEAVGLIHDTVKHPQMCAKRIAMEALQRGSKDNITVVVAFLQPVDTIENTFGSGQHKYTLTPTAYGSRQILQSSQYQVRDEMVDTY